METDAALGLRRTILYYPTISIPDTSWLRQAVLYFDCVASIVPSVVNWHGVVGRPLAPLPPYIRTLEREGVFRRIPPRLLFGGDDEIRWERSQQIIRDLQDALDTKLLSRAGRAGARTRTFMALHQDKMSAEVFEEFRQRRLVPSDELDFGLDEWVHVEERAAQIYMSLLAQALADVDSQLTVPGTNRLEYERLAFGAMAPDRGLACLDVRFANVVPTPRSDVTFDEILRFKRRRRDELLQFQFKLDELQARLSATQTQAEAKQVLGDFGDSLRVGLRDLTEALRADKLATVAGSLKCLIDAKSPTAWLTAMGAGAALVGGHIALASLTLPALGAVGVI